MNKSSITTSRNAALLGAMARGEPLADALRTAGLSPARALRHQRSTRFRRRLACFRRLLDRQRSLMLRGAIPDALAALLRALRDDQKPELQLKAAQTILQLTIPKARPRPVTKPPAPPEAPVAGITELSEEFIRADTERLVREAAERYAS
jgi:hypothetical protein